MKANWTPAATPPDSPRDVLACDREGMAEVCWFDDGRWWNTYDSHFCEVKDPDFAPAYWTELPKLPEPTQ
jgi:hypothetical protein